MSSSSLFLICVRRFPSLRSVSAMQFPPPVIRDARKLMVICLGEEMQVDDLTKAMALATPNKPCSNVGCTQMHLPEDCSLEPLCGGCGAYKSHFSHECAARCLRCGGSGHSEQLCSRTRHKNGHELSARPAAMPLRPNDPSRQIGSIYSRILAEVIKYRSGAADSSPTQDPVPRQGTIPQQK